MICFNTLQREIVPAIRRQKGNLEEEYKQHQSKLHHPTKRAKKAKLPANRAAIPWSHFTYDDDDDVDAASQVDLNTHDEDAETDLAGDEEESRHNGNFYES